MNALDQLLLNTYRKSTDGSNPGAAPTPAGNRDPSPAPPRDLSQGPAGEEPAERALPEEARAEETCAEIAAEDSAAEDSAADHELAVFKPDWEVDQFRWPDVCRQLTEQLGDKLDEVIQRLREQPPSGSRPNVFLVTSQGRQVGRSTLTLCLARRAAQRGLRAAVVDLDYRNPHLMSLLGIAADMGLESLCQGATVEGICVHALEDGVSLLPIVKPSSEAPWEWPNALAALAVVAAQHDLVFLDAPPLEDLGGLLAASKDTFTLGAILVQDIRESTAQELDALVSRLQQASVWPAGVVANFAA